MALSQNARYNLRKRYRSGHYAPGYLAKLYGITVAEVHEVVAGLTSRQLDDIRKRVERERRADARTG
jgi:hypothetical protein